jgi:hypothetical protein
MLLIGIVGWVFVRGSTVVIDRGGHVAEARIAVSSFDATARQRLFRLPGGIFVGMPHGDGVIMVRCKDGIWREGAYVSNHFHSWVEVDRRVGCTSELRIL